MAKGNGQFQPGLRVSELELMRTLFEEAPMFVGVTQGPDHQVAYLNATFRKLLGSPTLSMGLTAGQILPGIKSGDKEEVKSSLDRLDRIYTTGEPLIVSEFKTTLDRKGTGVLEEVYFNSIYQPLKDEEGNVYGLFLAGYEVTDHVKAREEIVYAEHRLSLALNGARLGYWEVDAESNRLDVASKQLKMHYGLPLDKDYVYEDIVNVIHPDDRVRVQEAVDEAMRVGRFYEVEYRVCWPDGSLHWLMARGRLLRDPQGRPYRRIGITMDITPHKEAEQKLKEAISLRDDFLAIASHELQTPLTSIKMKVELFERKLMQMNNHVLAEQARNISSDVDRLSSLTSSLLDVSQLQKEGLSLDMNNFSLGKLIEEKVEILQSISHHVIEVHGQAELEVYADRFRIGQVLTNIIENAIKYSPDANRIVVRYEEAAGKVIVSVVDFGIGVPKEDQQRIFERFFKGSSDSKNTYPGFGIGLYVSRQIVERHGGGIWVEDNPGGGSVFSFSLPASERPQ
jgi:PAS domain S-box-containing protein